LIEGIYYSDKTLNEIGFEKIIEFENCKLLGRGDERAFLYKNECIITYWRY
jgi:hypothetical protein